MGQYKFMLQVVNQKGILYFLLLLVSADLAFFMMHILSSYTHLLQDARLSLEHDGGYAEHYQYIKEYWIFILLAIAAIRFRQPSLAVWAVLYGYFLLDDALTLHEHLGTAIAIHLGRRPFLHLRMQDYGELLVASMILLIFLLLLFPALRRCSHRWRQTNLDLVVLLLLLAFCGVFLDTLHIFLSSIPGTSLFSLLEDGGEMLVMSLTCTYIYYLLQFKGEAPVLISSFISRRINPSQKRPFLQADPSKSRR